MIALEQVTKKYGPKTAVEDLTVEVASGKVTGFLGPNGAGKSTTMRIVLGLDRATSGRALINGRHYADLRHPLRAVGAHLDAGAAHPGRSARAHLTAMARSNGIPVTRVPEVLDIVGLTEVAAKRVGTFSMGMRQRVGIAAALLGDPPVLLFDEPVNGLDVDGVRWMRQLMRRLAGEGRTVFVSSHLLSEIQQTADHLVVIGRGRLIADAPAAEVIAGSAAAAVGVRSPDAAALAAQLRLADLSVEQTGEHDLVVTGGTIEQVGDIAHQCGARLHQLMPYQASLEQAYLELTSASTEYSASAQPVGARLPDEGAAA